METTVLDTAGVWVVDACCTSSAASTAREIQGYDRYEVLFVRSGCFTFRDTRGEVLVDPITCVLGSPRQLAEIAHPVPGGDSYTQIAVTAQVWHDLTLDTQVPLAARVSGAMQVAVRSLAAAGRLRGDDMELEEAALNLIASAVADAEPRRMAAGRAVTDRARRRLVADARAILLSDPALASVCQVARLLSCSPGHLSRIFRAHTGMTLAAYRTQLRLTVALQLLAEGATSIAEAAAESGFSDQAHLNRALRHHTGSTPGRVRAAVTARTRQPSRNLQFEGSARRHS